jgi:pseudouridine kinase
VLVAGGANVDIKCALAAAPVAATSNPAVVVRSAGGVARNVAENLARLGLAVRLAAVVGADAEGAWLRAATERAGVDCSLMVAAGASTDCYLAVLGPDGDLVIGANDMRSVEGLPAGVVVDWARAVTGCRWLVVDANLPVEALLALSAAACTSGVALAVEPVSVPKAVRLLPLFDAGRPVRLATPNRDQLAALTGMAVATEGDLASAVARLHGRGVAGIVVGLGGEGAYASDGVTARRLPARGGRPVDVTGAGDAAMAAALWAIDRGAGIVEAAAAGQIAAALTATTTATVSPELTAARLLRDLGSGY